MSKAIVVQKYGGSSVSSIQGIEQVAHRILDTVKMGYSVVAVVSAMGNTTNELLSLAKKISDTPPKRELDLLVSVGERVSMSLLAMALENIGGKAKSFTGSQSGIITTTNHGNSDIVEVRPHRIQKALEEGYIAIVAGFQGMSVHREVTTLGRGGSDTTAVALAAALNAEFCEVCSDVSGVYSTDPRVVPEAILLEDLGLERAISMAKNGAKVLHLEALLWCQKSGITLIANATANPVGQGTRLESRPSDPKELPIVAFDKELIALFNPSEDMLVRVDGAIRYQTIMNGVDTVIVDTRNLHCEWDTWICQKVATVTVLGGVTPRLQREWTTLPTVLYWWKDAENLTILVESGVSELVKQIHVAVYANVFS